MSNLIELTHRCEAIANQSLATIALHYNLSIPTEPTHAKGWVGQLIEKALGCEAGNSPQPDFPDLGIEVKTIPIDANGKPLESTYICVVPLLELTGMVWETSNVYRKTRQVLWVPIVTLPDQPIAERVILKPFLWSPKAEEEALLQQDWEELTERIVLGQLEEITARHGQVLQIRPKGANAKSLTWGVNAHGQRCKTLPRGFYLRVSFTRQILSNSPSFKLASRNDK